MKRIFLLGAIVVLAVPARADGQVGLQTVKDLYASAAYEDALTALGRVRLTESAPRAEMEIYRVFCLVALGRTGEAEAAVAALVNADPTFVPDPNDTPPRVQEVFSTTRQRLLPEIALRMYADAKVAFQNKDRDGAITRFAALERLLAGIDGESHRTLAELKTLAAGFLDLSRSLPAPEVVLPLPVAAMPQPVLAPPAPATPPQITRPVALEQEFPLWVPPDAVSRSTEFQGSVRVRISTNGTVESAEILHPVHPSYDGDLLQAARGWLYRPALQDGRPVPAEHIVQVRLRPRE
jgi:hypothetical protein